MFRTTLRTVALAIALPVLATAISSPAFAADPVTKVSIDDLGTVNYGEGLWNVATPTGGTWDSFPHETLFTTTPTDGGRWTLDNEGKVSGTTAVTSRGVVLHTHGEVAGTPEYAVSEKVRYSYFLGSGGYPALDSQLTDGVITTGDFFDSAFSYTGTWVPERPEIIVGYPSLDLRIQNPVSPFQRVSLHSNGAGSPLLSATSSTVNAALPGHNWWINSTAGTHNGNTSLSVSDLTTDFSTWEVVSFGFNLGRGAEGTLTVSSLTAMGQTFAFAPATAPTIAGVASVGSKLTAVAGDFASDNVLGYQWRRGSTIVGTSSTYTPTAADATASLHLTVTGTRGPKVITRQSASVTVAAGTLASMPTPTVAGTAKLGGTLSATAGSWGDGVTLGFQWLRNATPIAGATTSSYKPVVADVNAKVSVRVSGSKAGYASASATSAPVSVAAGTIAKAPTPTLKGTPKVGKKLTAKAGTWSSGVSLTYQWYRGTAKIAKATKSTYKVVAKDLRRKITVKVTGKKAGYTTITKSASVKA